MPTKPLGGLHFVITGDFGEDRLSIVKKLIALGAVRHSGITAKTNLLIAGTDPGLEKVKLARALGIRIADRTWLVGALALGKFSLAEQMKVEDV